MRWATWSNIIKFPLRVPDCPILHLEEQHNQKRETIWFETIEMTEWFSDEDLFCGACGTKFWLDKSYDIWYRFYRVGMFDNS